MFYCHAENCVFVVSKLKRAGKKCNAAIGKTNHNQSSTTIARLKFRNCVSKLIIIICLIKKWIMYNCYFGFSISWFWISSTFLFNLMQFRSFTPSSILSESSWTSLKEFESFQILWNIYSYKSTSILRKYSCEFY